MKLYKSLLIAAFLLLSLTTIAQHNYSIKKVAADSAWTQLNFRQSGQDFYAKQKALLKYREDGLKFWKMFPNDPRRYSWLFSTVRAVGGYMLYLNLDSNSKRFENILYKGRFKPVKNYSWPMNKKLLEDWESIYPQLKKEFIAYCNDNPHIGFGMNSPGCNQEIGLLVGELWSFLNLSLNKEYRHSQKIDLDKLKYLFTAITNILDKEPDRKDAPNRRIRDRNEFYEIMNWAFISRYKELGLSANDMKLFLNSIIQNSPSYIAQKWAIQRTSLFNLTEEPLLFKYASIAGEMIDLEMLRGKVVLVDFWSTNCSSCIARMPAIKAVYDKYKSQGFEVISACLNSGNETERIRKIEEKIGSTWPTLMIGGETKEDKPNSLGSEIWKKYGFWGVPQLLLLNKQGKLVMYNDKLIFGDFEPDVKKLLAENYKSNK